MMEDDTVVLFKGSDEPLCISLTTFHTMDHYVDCFAYYRRADNWYKSYPHPPSIHHTPLIEWIPHSLPPEEYKAWILLLN